MAFSDPQSITVNGSAKSMANVRTDPTATTYQTADENHGLVVSHQTTGKNRVRTLVKFTERKVVTDPISSQNDYDTSSISVTIDRPLVGWTATEIDNLVQGFKSWLSTANVTKLFGKEH